MICFCRGDEGLLWSGKTNSHMVIEPHKETTLELKVTVLRYGIYNLSSLNVSTTDNVVIRDQTNVPTLLTVEN